MDPTFVAFPIGELRSFAAGNPPYFQGDRHRLNAALRDQFVDHSLQLRLLIAAVDSGVPTDLKAAESQGSLRISLHTLPESLVAGVGLSNQTARWAVAAWAFALGLCDEAFYRDAVEGRPPSLVAREAPQVAREGAAIADRGRLETSHVAPERVMRPKPAQPVPRQRVWTWIGLMALAAGIVIVVAFVVITLANGNNAAAHQHHPKQPVSLARLEASASAFRSAIFAAYGQNYDKGFPTVSTGAARRAVKCERSSEIANHRYEVFGPVHVSELRAHRSIKSGTITDSIDEHVLEHLPTLTPQHFAFTAEYSVEEVGRSWLVDDYHYFVKNQADGSAADDIRTFCSH